MITRIQYEVEVEHETEDEFNAKRKEITDAIVRLDAVSFFCGAKRLPTPAMKAGEGR